MSFLAEAALLGFSSGPACVASCGPALFPWLVAERATARRTAALLGMFLSGRLAGYWLFALGAWALGFLVPSDLKTRSMLYGIADIGMGAVLVAYARLLVRPQPGACHANCPVSRAARLERRFRSAAPAVLGLLTGLNFCPPFVAAALRATERGSLAQTLFFFTVFFAGTAIWTIPSIAAGLLRRFEQAAFIARAVMFILAAYYFYLGTMALVTRFYA